MLKTERFYKTWRGSSMYGYLNDPLSIKIFKLWNMVKGFKAPAYLERFCILIIKAPVNGSF